MGWNVSHFIAVLVYRNDTYITLLCYIIFCVQGQLLLACEVTTPPVGYYLILPSPSHTLLIKPVAVSELMLPIEVTQQEENLSDVSLHLVQDSLGKVVLCVI